jgi:NADH-quinone oxidoreductase subunit A
LQLEFGGQATIGASWPFLAFIGLILVTVAVIMTTSFVLGQRHRASMTGEPYESGVVATDFPAAGFPLEFYRIAVFFVVFDVEAVFIYAWAVSLREAGWSGYVVMLFFVGVLLAALVYLWRLGSLDWRATSRRSRQG